MAKRGIQLDLDEFRDAFLSAAGRPIRTRNARRNAFSVLSNADELSASALSECFVSRTLALVVSIFQLIRDDRPSRSMTPTFFQGSHFHASLRKSLLADLLSRTRQWGSVAAVISREADDNLRGPIRASQSSSGATHGP